MAIRIDRRLDDSEVDDGRRHCSIQRARRSRRQRRVDRLHSPRPLFSRNQAITALTLAERLAVGYGDDDPFVMAGARSCSYDRPTHQYHDRARRGGRAGVAAIISYQHAYELVTSHGETGVTAHLLPFTVDGLIWAASMVVLDASRRHHRYHV